MYDNQWKKYRLRFLEINPDCYACGKRATEVDHLRPHQGCDKLFKQLDNHIPLCVNCHSTVTAKFDMKHVTGSSIDEKIKWLNSRRYPTDNWFPRRVKVLSSYE